MRGAIRTAYQTLWALDALLLVMIFTTLILILPMPTTRAPVSGR